MFNRCKHDWKILSEITSDSKMETMQKTGVTHIEGVGDMAEMCEKTIVQIVSCTKCGVIKKFVTKV
jgi:hypothetical protein